MSKSFVAFAAALATVPASAQMPSPPKLLVVISVDQLSADLLDEYRPQFTGGLARLSRGAVFRNGYQGHAATETCPGHATIATGQRPARNGMIANYWTDPTAPREDKRVYCVEHERVEGSTSSDYTVSPVHLRAKTLGELMKARWPASRTVAVTGKDRSAVMMSGQKPDQRWYWGKDSFVTDLANVAAPRSAVLTNAAVSQAIATTREPLEPPPFCAAKAKEIELEGSGRKVGNGRFPRAAGDADAFTNSPERDAATLALAAALAGEMKLGQGRAPDLLAIGLSATDSVGHRYGPGGQEMCLQLLSLDRDLAGFFGVLDRSGVDYAVALTADHGAQDIPERLRLKGVNAVRADPSLSSAEIGKAVAAKLGLQSAPLIGGFSGNIYIDPSLPAAMRAKVLDAAIAVYRAHPQVEAAFTAAELKATPMPTGTPDAWTLAERARASFDPGRSGDIVVLLRRYVTPIRDTKDTAAAHGSAWDYDRRVPILFWRPGMKAADNGAAIETVDIMPTLAAMIELPLAAGSVDGECLLNIEGAICPPR
jgi:predicted AlkP superfamily pyrophosphatase or phosphodiesterase